MSPNTEKILPNVFGPNESPCTEHLTSSLPAGLSPDLLELHRLVINENGLIDSYLNFVDQGETLSQFQRNGLEVSVGPIGAFSGQDVTVLLHAAIVTYVEKETMGDFPKEDTQAWKDLIAIFAQGFSAEDHFVMVKKKLDSGESVIAGGCLVRPGNSEIALSQAIGDPNATHSTLESLVFTIPTEHKQLDEFLPQIAACPVSNTYCASRFFRLDDAASEHYAVSPADNGHVVSELIAGVERARLALETRLDRPLAFGLADIHDPRFARLVSRFGNWHILTTTNQPTDAVMQTILKHHYGYYTSGGREIHIVCGPAVLTKEATAALDQKLDQDHVHALSQNVRASERKARQASHILKDQLNRGELTPQLFDLSDPDQRRAYMEALQNLPGYSLIDPRLTDLTALYKRFHPRDPNFNPNTPHLSSHFRRWLKQNNFTPPFFHQGARLILPHRANADGTIHYDVICALPEPLHRQVKEAGANDLFSPEVRAKIHGDVDVLVIGTSVGTSAALALKELGVQAFTLADFDIQNGISGVRTGIDDPAHTGLLKILNLQNQILRTNPYARINLVPEGITRDNISDVLLGIRQSNPNRKLFILEEIDTKPYKDLIRDVARELFPDDPNVIIFSAADLEQSEVAAVIEDMADEPYAGLALKSGADDAYGRGISQLENEAVAAAAGLNPNQASALSTLAQIMATYGLVTKDGEVESIEDIGLSPLMVQSLFRLLSGQVGSFEQSPLSTRLSAYFAGTTLIAWLEGTLNTNYIRFNGRWLLDNMVSDPQVLKSAQKAALALQQQLGIPNS
jgi:hypothetical protein